MTRGEAIDSRFRGNDKEGAGMTKKERGNYLVIMREVQRIRKRQVILLRTLNH